MDVKVFHEITCEEFLEVIESVGFKTYSKEQVNKALQNTMEPTTFPFSFPRTMLPTPQMVETGE